MDKNCLQCGNIFKAKLGEIKRGGAKYCSPKCSQQSQKGKKRIFSEKWRENIGKAMKGRIFTKIHKKRMSEAQSKLEKPWTSKRNYEHRGENHPCWKGGISSIDARLRRTKESKDWIQKVLWRDKHTCVKCRSKKNLQADHIKPFSLFPESRLDINNGQTLCKDCHKIKTKEDIIVIRKAFN